MHPRLAAEAGGAGRGQDRAGAAGHRAEGRSFRAAGADPCRARCRTLFRCRRGDHQGSGNRHPQYFDPALPGGRQGSLGDQHRCRPASRDLSCQGGRAWRAAALHAQRRRRSRPAFRRGDPGRGGADGYRRTRHRQPLPRPAAGTGCRHHLWRRDGGRRDVRARMRNGAGRTARGRSLRRGHRLLRHRGAASAGAREEDPPPAGAGVPDHHFRRRGVQFRRLARRGECVGAIAEAGAGRQGRVLLARRLRLLPCRGADRAKARRLGQAGADGGLRRVSAAEDGHRGRR